MKDINYFVEDFCVVVVNIARHRSSSSNRIVILHGGTRPFRVYG